MIFSNLYIQVGIQDNIVYIIQLITTYN